MPLTIAIAVAAWIALIAVARWCLRRLAVGPGGDAATGLLWIAIRIYGRLMHRTTYRGLEHVPDTNRPGGLIVVANHTSAVDPLLIQAACRFEIRWMMAREMMVPQLEGLWRRYRLIPVARNGRDLAGAREAIRHVRSGGVIGIFPEGAIVRPVGEVRLFLEGAGLLVARTKAPVLLTWVRDTPEPRPMMKALATRSRSRVDFIDMIDYGDQRDAGVIARDLRRRLAEASGWPLREEPAERTVVNSDPFAIT